MGEGAGGGGGGGVLIIFNSHLSFPRPSPLFSLSLGGWLNKAAILSTRNM